MDRPQQERKVDVGTFLVIGITGGLFLVAVFVKGIGKELLLEAGVLMVSIKLIIMSFKNEAESRAVREDLDHIVALLERDQKSSDRTEHQHDKGTAP